MESNVIVGINCSHDASVCILVDGELKAALCEERMTRRKHQSGFPAFSLQECLSIAGLNRLIKPSLVVLNQLPPSDNMPCLIRAIPNVDLARVQINPSHHLLHACYAKAASGFQEAAILVVDGSGYSYGEHSRRGSPLLAPIPGDADAWESLSMFYCDKLDKMTVVHRQWGLWIDNTEGNYRFPSLGHLYSLVAQRLFGSWTHAGKVMGLAPYGDPNEMPFDMVHLTPAGVEVMTDWSIDLPTITKSDAIEFDRTACNLAAKVQSELERAMLHLVGILARRTSSQHLCLTGGVALNSVCNGRIVQEGPFQNVFVTPAAQDAGVAIGAAAYGHHTLTGSFPNLSKRQEFFGREYSKHRIALAIDSAVGIKAEEVNDPADLAAADIAEGRFVGWFEGAGEFGPRALGHRSILADPRGAHVKDQLNSRVKYREAFRPYAASVLCEEASDWFSLPIASPHMLLVGKVASSKKDKVPAIVHVDGSCRLQTVGQDHPGELRRVIERFRARTGVPLVLNTSLNLRGEPTCETPEDALRCFLRSGLDALYLGHWRVVKWPNPSAASDAFGLVPTLHEGVLLNGSASVSNGGWTPDKWSVSVGSLWSLSLEEPDACLLRLVNGRYTVQDLARELRMNITDVFERLQMLQARGVLYLATQN
jgi:carbamoyltransferase